MFDYIQILKYSNKTKNGLHYYSLITSILHYNQNVFYPTRFEVQTFS